jgi:gamma-glutamyltranspeptidase/glutathione hydrolase
MVDGVSIGDAASFQQAAIKATGPGNRLPSPIEVGIISKNGKPIIPFASMSMGLHQQTVQSILNIIAFDMSIEEAVNAPSILLPETDASDPKSPKTTVRVMEGDFSEKTIKESGLPISKHAAKDRRYMQGLWIGIYRNPETGLLEAVSPPYATGVALAK